MFVNKLDIKEFRGIKSCKKPLEFSNFNVLIGRNNSGKSTILEALSLLPAHFINDYISGMSKANFLLKLHNNQKRLLYLYAGSSELKYNLKGNIVKCEITERGFTTFFREKQTPNINFIGRYLDTPPFQLDKLVFFISDTSILNVLENRMRAQKEMIVKKGFHIKLAKFLNKCVNDEYSEIVFLDPISLRKIYADNKVYIELKDLGSGAEKVIKIMALLEVLNARLVIMDDFEAGLHPSLLKLFLKWLKEKNCQIVISTHSIDVLYHLVDINPSDTMILQLNKSNEDILNHKVLTLEQLEIFLNANNDPRLLVDLLNM